MILTVNYCMRGRRDTSADSRRVAYHACSRVSLESSNVLVTWGTNYGVGSEISNWQSQPQGMHDSALKETGFKNQSVSTTNLLDSNIKERVQAGKDPSLSPSFLL